MYNVVFNQLSYLVARSSSVVASNLEVSRPLVLLFYPRSGTPDDNRVQAAGYRRNQSYSEIKINNNIISGIHHI